MKAPDEPQFGQLYVVSAPSGAGKTTLLRRLVETDSQCFLSVSHTTRSPRPGEIDGRDYFFVSRRRFSELIEADAFLEWAEVHGNRYGTTRRTVHEQRSSGYDVILEIDVLGHEQVKQTDPTALSIFITAPSLDELRRRLMTRGTDEAETIRLRLENARRELLQLHKYDFVVVNDRLDACFDQLWSIVKAERCRTAKLTKHFVESIEKIRD